MVLLSVVTVCSSTRQDKCVHKNSPPGFTPEGYLLDLVVLLRSEVS